jgi:DNA-directed RNA polymerase subunit RPC12/RpoP
VSEERFKRIGAELAGVDEKLICPKCGSYPLIKDNFNFYTCSNCHNYFIRNNDRTEECQKYNFNIVWKKDAWVEGTKNSGYIDHYSDTSDTHWIKR